MNLVKYIPLALFSSYSIKTLIAGATLTDAAALLVFAAIAAFYEFKSNEKKLLEQDAKIKELSDQISTILRNHDDLRTHVAGLKMGQQMRAGNVRQ